MVDREKLKNIVYEYRKSIIQSEAEVRSKLIVPLIEALGFPSELRAEEYPVYSWHGGKQMPCTQADFILFSDSTFANYRGNSTENNKWVQNHSLMVFEAKKPNQLPSDIGQAKFYADWTKAPAYIMCDGERIRAFYHNPIKADSNLIDCCVDELANSKNIELFSYEHLSAIKDEQAFFHSDKVKFQKIKVEEFDLSNDNVDRMRRVLNLPAQMSGKEVLQTFENHTNAFLERDLRYRIPEYMLGIPRAEYAGTLYVDNDVFPLFSGKVKHYYRDEIDRFEFANEYFSLEVTYSRERLVGIIPDYDVKCKSANERLQMLNRVRRVLTCQTVYLNIESIGRKVVSLDQLAKDAKSIMNHERVHIDYWIGEMKKIRRIEEYYEVAIELKPLLNNDDAFSFYKSVDCIYNGIIREQNCVIFFSKNPTCKEDVEITEPVLFETGDIKLPTVRLHDCVFEPKESILLPTKIKKREWRKGIIEFPAVCIYCIAKSS